VRRVPVAPAATPSPTPAAATPAATAPAPATLPAPPATQFTLDGAPSGRLAADPQTLAPSPSILSNLSVDDVAAVGDIDFSKPSTVVIALADGGMLTLTGTVVGDKHWIQVAAPKDAPLSAKSSGRAFEISGYRYDVIFRPLEQLLVPKPVPPKPTPTVAKPPIAKKPAPATKP
jgi:hypothetical protein